MLDYTNLQLLFCVIAIFVQDRERSHKKDLELLLQFLQRMAKVDMQHRLHPRLKSMKRGY